MPATGRRWGRRSSFGCGRWGKVHFGGVESAGRHRVEGGVELEAARLVVTEDLGEHLGAGGHQVGGHGAAVAAIHYLRLVVVER